MSHRILLGAFHLCVAFVPAIASAQLPPIRRLVPIATSRETFEGPVEVRALSDGRALVKEQLHRRLLMLDASLGNARVVFDAASRPPMTFPTSLTRLIPGTADSTYFFDGSSRQFRVIDPAGKLVRRQMAPGPDELFQIGAAGVPVGFDSAGRVLFAKPATRPRRAPGAPAPPGPLPPPPDSVVFLRVDFARMRLDTILWVYVPRGPGIPLQLAPGLPGQPRPPVERPQPPRQTTVLPAFTTNDLRTITSDGIIAIVRSSDYHVDWFDGTGSMRSSPPVPWPWTLLTPSDRQRLRDSLQQSYDAIEAARGTPDRVRDLPLTFGLTHVLVDSQMPDRIPAFGSEIRADRDGRIWVREGYETTRGVTGPPVYDILDRNGAIVDRVLLPTPEHRLTGFGRGGIVFLLAPGPYGEFVLQRATVPLPR